MIAGMSEHHVPPAPRFLSGMGGFVTAVLLCSTLFIAVRLIELPLLKSPDGYALSEPDGYMRMYLVRRAMEGGRLRPSVVEADNAPQGRLNEWTTPMTAVALCTTRLATMLGATPAGALRAAGLLTGSAIGWLALLVLGVAGRRLGGNILGFSWMLAWAVLPDILAVTRLGNPDHHSLHALLFVCMVLTVYAGPGARPALAGTSLGVITSVAVWSAGSELLPAFALVAALAVYETHECVPARQTQSFWRSWYASGFIITSLALFLDFRPQPFHDRLELLSASHAVAWLGVGWLVERGSRSRNRLIRACEIALALGV